MVAVYKQDDVLKVNTGSIQNITAKKLYIKTYLNKLQKRKSKVLSGKQNKFDTTTSQLKGYLPPILSFVYLLF